MTGYMAPVTNIGVCIPIRKRHGVVLKIHQLGEGEVLTPHNRCHLVVLSDILHKRNEG